MNRKIIGKFSGRIIKNAKLMINQVFASKQCFLRPVLIGLEVRYFDTVQLFMVWCDIKRHFRQVLNLRGFDSTARIREKKFPCSVGKEFSVWSTIILFVGICSHSFCSAISMSVVHILFVHNLHSFSK